MRERLRIPGYGFLAVLCTALPTAALLGAGAPATSNGQATPTSTPMPASRISYPPGWNLVAGPPGTVLTGTDGPLYTYPAGATSYQQVSASTALQTGVGYWAFFDNVTPETLPTSGPQSLQVQMPAAQYVMIGNPRSSLVLVTGADVVYVYDPVIGYEQTVTLEPGQGAWAFSYSGATITISNVSP